MRLIECLAGCPSRRSSPRADHTRSRGLTIDPDALKVLYRLHQAITSPTWSAAACATCCSDRRPKDFDIGTSAHPHEVKRLFRNCWIIGRRFRLVHVKFGTKTIEVATFRRQLSEQELAEQEAAAREAARAGRGAASRAAAIGRTCIRATTRSARRKRTRSAATSPSTRCSTTSRRSRSSTTPAASRICSARVDSLDWRSERAIRGRSGADAARGGAGRAARLHDRSGRGRCHPAARAADRQGVAGAAARGVLQDPAVGGVGARVSPARRGRPARAPRARADRRTTARRSGRRWRRSTRTGIDSRPFPSR